MPLTAGPETVDTAVNNGVASFWYMRPVEVVNGTDRWIFLLKTTGATWQIRAYLRNNVALTWAEQAAGTGPLVSKGTLAGLQTPFGCPTYIVDPVDPTKVLIAYPRASDSTLAFIPFDMVAKTFGVPVTGGPVVHGVDQVFIGSVFSDDTGAKTCISYRPIDNKLLFSFQGPPEVLAHTCLRPYYVTYDRTGAAWGVAVDGGFAGVVQPFEPLGIVTDQATSISYATFLKPNGGTAATTQELWYAQIDANDTIHAPVMAANDIVRAREPFVSYPVLQNLGGNTILNVAYYSTNVAGTVAVFKVARCLVGPAPVFALEAVSGFTPAADAPGGDAFIGPQIAIGSDGNPVVFWINDIDTYRLWVSVGGAIGAPWSAALNFWTVTDQVNDLMERISVSFLPGI